MIFVLTKVLIGSTGKMDVDGGGFAAEQGPGIHLCGKKTFNFNRCSLFVTFFTGMGNLNNFLSIY